MLLLLESDSVSELEVEVPETVYTLAAWLWVGEGEQQDSRGPWDLSWEPWEEKV